MDSLGKGGQAFMLREVGADSLDDLASRLAGTVEAAGAIIDRALAVPATATPAVTEDAARG